MKTFLISVYGIFCVTLTLLGGGLVIAAGFWVILSFLWVDSETLLLAGGYLILGAVSIGAGSYAATHGNTLLYPKIVPTAKKGSSTL